MKKCNYLKASGIDYKGQLQKIPKSRNKLQPLFEALTNSIEAIKLNNNIRQGIITVSLNFESGLYSNETNEYSLSAITVEDNGVGFNEQEFERFQNLHDNTKGSFNRGSGRVQYMHFFDRIEFQSIYKDINSRTGFYERIFTLSKSESFLEQKSIICYHEPIEKKTTEQNTKITFKKLLHDNDIEYYNKLSIEYLKVKIIEHYLYYFCENRDSLPKIYIKSFIDKKELKQEEININNIPKEDKTKEIKIQYKQLSTDNELIKIDKEEIFYIKAFKLSEKLLHSNSLKLTSKHEIVEGKIAKKIELDTLKPDDVIDNNRYLFLVSSEYIDVKDDDNRGDIKIYTEEEFKKDTSLFKEHEVILLDDIQNNVNSSILSMYTEILDIRNKHQLDINKLQKMFLLDKKTLKSIRINVQDTDETILKKVYKADAQIIAEKDAKIKEQIDSLSDLNPASDNYENYQNDLKNRVSSLVKVIPLQNRTALTHTVARRKLVLELFQKTLDNELKIQKTTNRNIDEELLHNIVFQQSSNESSSSDLWLINEDFIYFNGTSENRLGDIEVNGKKILKEDNQLTEEEKTFIKSLDENRYAKKPDILLFPNEGKCIIIEFKNPNVNVAKHLHQIDNYASLIWNFAKKEFQFNTFYGYLIGEKIESKEVRMYRSTFQEAYHFDYLFRPHEPIAGIFRNGDASLYTEVIKYSTLLNRAKKRNEIFIDKLMGKS